MSNRRARVYAHGQYAGDLWQTDDAYFFQYNDSYRARTDAHPVSLTLPLKAEPYRSRIVFPFFDGLVPEGWLLDIAVRNWKIDPRDRMGLLMCSCMDCIGAVSIEPVEGGDA